MFYVWNGKGARLEEKKAAFAYAAGLCGDAESVIVLDEGENDEDEMFWAVLGDGDREYARASYWAWRAGVNLGDPQLWEISASRSNQVGIIYLVTDAKLMHPSPRTSPPILSRRSRIMSSFWTLYGRYLSSSVLRRGASGRIST